MEKKEFRDQYKNLRNHMPPEQVQDLSQRICRGILESNVYRKAERIYAYYPLGNEADIRPVIADAWAQGKRVALPRVNGREMSYFEIHDFSELKSGAFGVMEPDPERKESSVEWPRALVLTPGVAFDRSGNRMGYGGGYYDRYFGHRKDCTMLGVAYELQIAEKIPVGEYDRAMDGIVTEQGIFLKS